MHKPIQINNLSLSFSHKICFENLNVQVSYGSRIGIIGRNGSGKSLLLKMIAGDQEPDVGSIEYGGDAVIGYVPQVIEHHMNLSGGERLNKSLTQSLALRPNILLLDEPTNHLDQRNRKSLMKMLKKYVGTLIVVSHDRELLRNSIDIFWHIDNGKIHVFSGNYDDYLDEIKLKHAVAEDEIKLLNRHKTDMHHKLMRAEQRSAKSRASGQKKIENRKWLKTTGDLKAMKAEKSQGKKLKDIEGTKIDLLDKLAGLRPREIIVPKFSIESLDVNRTLVQINDGSAGYFKNQTLLSGINFSLFGNKRVGIIGNNGSGKSTFIRAILEDNEIHRTGDWFVIKREDIGYLDQHYSTLDLTKSVLETISELTPHLPYDQLRIFLNDFLFRKNEEVNALVANLSGGEKARLSLAQIAAKTPKLLILDEITNNLDLETLDHIRQVLNAYPGGIMAISHDADFLKEIGVSELLDIEKFRNI